MSKTIKMVQPVIGRHEFRAVKKVLKSGFLAQGPEVSAFEREFSKIVEDRDCIAVNSGTSALILAIMSLGIKAGDEVIVPSFSFAASANSIVLSGAKPIFCDIDPRTFNIDANQIESLITPNTKAILVVHLFGLMSDMRRIVDIAGRHNLYIIEDSAQAHLASQDGKASGTFGDVAAFSFYPSKNMTTGEGGMVVARESNVARMVRLLRNQGMESRYKNEIAGFNMRMTDLSAAVGRQQLKKLQVWTDHRVRNASFYQEGLPSEICPIIPSGFNHVFHQFTLKIDGSKRSLLQAALTSNQIQSDVYYPTPIHRLPAFNLELNLPVTNKSAQEVLSIPVHPSLNKKQLVKVRNTINRFLEQHEN